MVTKDMLAQLRAERRQALAQPSLTPDGTVTAEVNGDLDRDRERTITLHEMAFSDAQRHMRLDHAMSRLEGHTKSIFNNPTPEMKL